jgi:putative oxidoreductase
MSGGAIARLLLRGVVGTTMIAHGVKHGKSQQGTAGWFGGIGFRKPELQARLSSVVEIGAGAGVLAGAATPVSASAVVGTMAVAARTVHLPNGFFITGEGYEYVLNLATASTALAALGPGPCSVDRLLGIERKLSGGRGAAIAAGLGLAAAAGQLAVYWKRPSSQ